MVPNLPTSEDYCEQSVSQLFQLLSHVWLFATPWPAACQVSLSITNSQSLLKLMSIKSIWMASRWLDAIQPSHPLSSPSPVAFNLYQHQSFFPTSEFFESGGQSIGASTSSISPSNEYSGLISFRIDWFDLLAVQRTLESLLQHHSLKASILWLSAFFIVQHSNPYLTIRKTERLTFSFSLFSELLCVVVKMRSEVYLFV